MNEDSYTGNDWRVAFLETLPEPTWKDKLAKVFYTCIFNIAYYPLRWAYIAWDAIDDAFYIAWEREDE